MTSGLELGAIGENTAADFLIQKGYKILARNFRKPFGEIDIVANLKKDLIFVEVKSSWYYPASGFLPEYRVNRKKILHLKKICQAYLLEHKVSDEQKWRIDTISVIVNHDGTIQDINHLEHAVFEKPY